MEINYKLIGYFSKEFGQKDASHFNHALKEYLKENYMYQQNKITEYNLDCIGGYTIRDGKALKQSIQEKLSGQLNFDIGGHFDDKNTPQSFKNLRNAIWEIEGFEGMLDTLSFHPWADFVEWQLGRSLNTVLEDKYMTVDFLNGSAPIVKCYSTKEEALAAADRLWSEKEETEKAAYLDSRNPYKADQTELMVIKGLALETEPGKYSWITIEEYVKDIVKEKADQYIKISYPSQKEEERDLEL